jgi:hypothetical protein
MWVLVDVHWKLRCRVVSFLKKKLRKVLLKRRDDARFGTQWIRNGAGRSTGLANNSTPGGIKVSSLAAISSVVGWRQVTASRKMQ